MKLTFPSLNMDMPIVANRDAGQKKKKKKKKRMANGVDPDYEPSHQDLYCLHRYNVCDLVCSV